MSSNLRNKNFYIYNKSYSKEEYFKELEKFNLKSRVSRESLNKEFIEIRSKTMKKTNEIIWSNKEFVEKHKKRIRD